MASIARAEVVTLRTARLERVRRCLCLCIFGPRSGGANGGDSESLVPSNSGDTEAEKHMVDG